MGRAFLGEFEQRVLLAILRCDAKATPIEVRREVLRAGRFPDDWDGPNGAQNLMAVEIHVHLLARGDAAAVAVLGDLAAAMKPASEKIAA